MVPRTRSAPASAKARLPASSKLAGKLSNVTKKRVPVRRPSKVHLSAFFKTYKCTGSEIDPLHFRLLQAVAAFINLTPLQTVLYPGCHRHITPSLFFPRVTYVDNYAKLQPLFSDPAVHQWIDEHKMYKEPAQLLFECKDFGKPLPVKCGSVDLMISASAGIVSTTCSHYLKPSTGYLLVSDAHFDAKQALLHPDVFEPIAFWDGDVLQTNLARFHEHFQVISKGDKTKKAKQITMAQLDECKAGLPRAKWSFVETTKRPLFFLFRRC